ncbi:family 43 glycosylhydrolase [Luteolibacter arcticus]|uniref:Family 43 glycosylhydrolase n=1 Tax=Luteolibacter arcticus TaxID=1581411 RepID=A0ABT3GE43_9BACT|nr:family 43 glycosylhydrolase [Luteolibacter arcticus]MCW1921877.1 family 43 glycosylhydrolase [Luteolibacter arcticus]
MNNCLIKHVFDLISGAKWPSLLAVTVAGLVLYGGAPKATGQEPAAATYRNPVIAGDFCDPSVILVGDTYYASGTSSEWAPHYPIYTSKDLVNWEHIGHVFEKMPDWTVGSFWAPELYHHNGTFCVYYTARRKSDNVSVVAVATSDDPRKGFTDRGIICEWGSEAIDGFVFKDNDGKLYFSWKAYGLERDRPVSMLASEMTDDALKLKGEAFELKLADGKPISAEGQVMTRRGDWYYLFYSSKGCCGRGCDYQVEVARAKSLKGPWENSPVNPILAGGDAWICPGHGTLVDLPDKRSFFLYHAYNAKETVYTGRQGLLGEVVWQDNGWPVFAGGRTPVATAASPLGKPQQASGPVDFVDSFDESKLAPSWQWDLQRPPTTRLADGLLHLGVTDAPDASPAGTFLGVRVQQGDYTLTATIDPSGPAQEGIAIYGEATSALALRIEDKSLVLSKIEKGEPKQLATTPLPEGQKLHLRMTVREGHLFRFSASANGKDWKPIGEQEIDGAFIPPWDRAPRAGLVVSGKPGDTGTFDSVELRYERP